MSKIRDILSFWLHMVSFFWWKFRRYDLFDRIMLLVKCEHTYLIFIWSGFINYPFIFHCWSLLSFRSHACTVLLLSAFFPFPPFSWQGLPLSLLYMKIRFSIYSIWVYTLYQFVMLIKVYLMQCFDTSS